MAILHTGQGFFKDAGIGFYPAEFVKQVGDDQVKLEQYRQQLQMQREQEFLKMTSVDMENLVFEQYQLKAKDMYDKFMDENTQTWKSKKGILSTEDKMKVIRSQQAIQNQVSTMKSKAQKYIEVKDTLAKDGGYRYDEWLMKEEMDNFVKDPINNPVPTLKARPVNLDQYILDNAPKWVQNPKLLDVNIGAGQIEKRRQRYRFGIESEGDLKNWINNFIQQDPKAGYAYSTPYYNRDIDSIVERLKPEMLPYDYEDVSVSSSFHFGGGKSKGTIGYSNISDPQLGETVNITGNLAPFTLNVDGNRKKVIVRAIGENGIKVDYSEVVPDKSFEGLDFSKASNPYAEAEARYKNPIQDKNGLWYPSKTETRDRIIGKDSTELMQYYDEIEKAIRAGKNTNSEDFLKAWNKFKADVEQKKKAVPSQPKKQIKRGDIKAKAKAAGYSEAEYTEMLKKNNIEIVD